jgi:hypothetical protein
LRRWIWIATLLAPVAWGASQVWDHFHPERKYREVSRELSPSGRWRAEQHLGWVQAGFSVAEWIEVRLIDRDLGDRTHLILEGSQYPLALQWENDSTLHITVRNSIYVGTRMPAVEDIKIELTFEPDDPVSRRGRLIVGRVPREKWWMYDIPVD